MRKRGFSDVPTSELRAVQSEVRRLARTIQERRKELGFTQESLAEEMDVSDSTIKTIETGRRMPSFPMLIRLSRALKLKVMLESV